MTKPNVTWDFNIGSIVHIVVLLLTAGAIYGHFSDKLESLEELKKQTNDVRGQTTRIEHYLSSEDREYWHKVTQNGDNR